MTKVLCTGGESDTLTSTANTTEYWACGGASGAGYGANTIEADSQTMHKNAGTFSNLFVSLQTNGIAGTTTFTFRKNAADATMVVSVPSSSTGNFTEGTLHTDNIVSGDKTGLKSIPGATTGTFKVTTISVIFLNTSSSDTISRLTTVSFQLETLNTASFTAYDPIAGELAATPQSTESLAKCRFRKAGSFKNVGVNVKSNLRTTATTFTVRINGADTLLSASVPGSTTGWIEDTTDNPTVAVGDDVNWKFVTGTGTGALKFGLICVDYINTSGWFPMMQALVDGVTALTAASTNFMSLGGEGGFGATEAAIDQLSGVAFTFAELAINVTTNGPSGASSCTLRKNAVDTALTAPITGATTGVFLDSSHSFTTIGTDLVNHKIVVGSGTGNLNYKSIVVWGQEIQATLPQTILVVWEEM